VTSLSAAHASPARLADDVRGHWGIEALHHLRDAASPRMPPRPRTDNAPRAMASLCNLAIGILHAHGDGNIAAALCRNARDPTRVLPLLGVTSRETERPPRSRCDGWSPRASHAGRKADGEASRAEGSSAPHLNHELR
jgi:hypothetical protein